MKLKKKRIVSVMTSDWKELDEDLITSEVCMQCGKCCKTTWIQERYTDSGNTPISEGKTPSDFPNDGESGNSNLSKLQQGKHVKYHDRTTTATKRGDTSNSSTSEIKYSAEGKYNIETVC